MRKFFDEEIRELDISLIKLFSCSQDSINILKKNLSTIDTDYSIPSREMFYEAESLSVAIEGRCVRLLIHQQPVASDLRKIKSAMSVVYDLVRICEMSYHIARMKANLSDKLPRLTKMTDLADKMMLMCSECYLKRNYARAKEIIADDDIIDNEFIAIRADIIALLKASDDNDDLALDSLLISKYLERIADHTVNIAKVTLTLA